MRSSTTGAIPSELGDIIDDLVDLSRRLDNIESPSGEALASSVAKLEALIEDIQDQLDAWAAGRWTNSQITTEINNSHVAHDAGNVTIAGEFRAPNAYAFDITYTRRTAWLGNDGRLGWASSSRRRKTAIRRADINPRALLGLNPVTFEYIAEHAERERRAALPTDDPEYHPDYPVSRELGLLAEDLHDAGLGDVVIYDEQGRPDGIEYSMLVVPIIAAMRHFDTRLAALEKGRR